MDIRFENRYYSSRKMLAEFGRKFAIGPKLSFVIGFWALYLFAAVPVFAVPEAFDSTARTLLTVLGIVMAAVTFLPEYYGWLGVRNVKKQNDGVQPPVRITFGETIELHEGMVHITVEYRKIEKVLRLKHSYMLMIGKRNGVMLDPDGFVQGSFPEFKDFLREKRPDLFIPE